MNSQFAASYYTTWTWTVGNTCLWPSLVLLYGRHCVRHIEINKLRYHVVRIVRRVGKLGLRTSLIGRWAWSLRGWFPSLNSILISSFITNIAIHWCLITPSVIVRPDNITSSIFRPPYSVTSVSYNRYWLNRGWWWFILLIDLFPVLYMIRGRPRSMEVGVWRMSWRGPGWPRVVRQRSIWGEITSISVWSTGPAHRGTGTARPWTPFNPSRCHRFKRTLTTDICFGRT